MDSLLELKQRAIYDPNLVFYADLSKHDGPTFESDDAFGHTLTVTGATWGIQGRLFDGLDDFISAGDQVAFRDLPVFTWSVWIKPTNFTVARYPLAKRHYKNLYLATSGAVWVHIEAGNGNQSQSSNILSADKWVFLSFTYNDNGDRLIRIYIDNAEVAYSAQVAVTGAVVAETGAAAAFIIGAYSATETFFLGEIGETFIHRRVLTPLEIQHLYLSTRWKYQ